MLIYKTPTIVSTDLFDLEKRWAPGKGRIFNSKKTHFGQLVAFFHILKSEQFLMWVRNFHFSGWTETLNMTRDISIHYPTIGISARKVTHLEKVHVFASKCFATLWPQQLSACVCPFAAREAATSPITTLSPKVLHLDKTDRLIEGHNTQVSAFLLRAPIVPYWDLKHFSDLCLQPVMSLNIPQSVRDEKKGRTFAESWKIPPTDCQTNSFWMFLIDLGWSGEKKSRYFPLVRNKLY